VIVFAFASMLPSLIRFHFFFLWSGQCMFGCERCKAHLERFSRVRSAGLATALSKIIPFDRRSVVHETFPPVGQSSSGVEQRTHTALVGGSNPSSGTNFTLMPAAVYLLRSRTGRYYYGSTTDLARRLEQHSRGHTATTAKDGPWQLIANRDLSSLEAARKQERIFKRWKNRQGELASDQQPRSHDV